MRRRIYRPHVLLNMSNFHGHDTGELTNGIVTLEYLKNAGPRIIRFGLKDDRNVLAEIPDFEMDDTDLKLLGGHRLWHAPEAHNRTDLPTTPHPQSPI